MKCQEDKIWLEYIPNLICDSELNPFMRNITVEKRFNILTRIIFILFIVMLLLKVDNSFFVFVVSLLILIIVYYIQMNRSNNSNPIKSDIIENYDGYATLNVKGPDLQRAYDNAVYEYKIPKRSLALSKGKKKCNSDPQPFMNDDVNLDNFINNSTYKSMNQRLVGKPNPKTMVPPVIVPPIADMDYWKDNNMTTYQAINSQTNTDLYKSGYVESSCDSFVNKRAPCNYMRNVVKPSHRDMSSFGGCGSHNNINHNNINHNINHNTNQGCSCKPNQCMCMQSGIDISHNNNIDHNSISHNNINHNNINHEMDTLNMNVIDDINCAGGISVSNKRYNLPINMQTTNCMKTDQLSQYNKNLFTNTIQPGVFYKNDIIEPINANIGISFEPQIGKTVINFDREGNVLYTENGSFQGNFQNNNCIYDSIPESDIYDPRFTGYGTSYREYIDDVTGQPRFFYDDVDAVRMPGYIVRSNIDNQPFADQYGPDREQTNDVRSLANDAFANSTIQFRTGLQESLMRKVNSEKWQQRMYPISTAKQRMGW
jgi:hypothetical protein